MAQRRAVAPQGAGSWRKCGVGDAGLMLDVSGRPTEDVGDQSCGNVPSLRFVGAASPSGSAASSPTTSRAVGARVIVGVGRGGGLGMVGEKVLDYAFEGPSRA